MDSVSIADPGPVGQGSGPNAGKHRLLNLPDGQHPKLPDSHYLKLEDVPQTKLQIKLPAHPSGAFGQITRQVRGCLKQVAQHSPKALLAVACSGGADSLALAAALASVGPGLRFQLAGVTVDHGWRAESHAQAQEVIKVLQRLGYQNTSLLSLAAAETSNYPGSKTAPASLRPEAFSPLTSVSVSKSKNLGKEAGGRQGRYAAFDAWAKEYGQLGKNVFILLGHTLDDQAETVLLGLARGSGPRAISGMSPWRGGYLRPLLDIRRQQTQAACEQLGLTYLIDPTNLPNSPIRAADGTLLRRSALRYQGIPALKSALQLDPKPALAKTAKQLQEDLYALDLWAKTAFEQAKNLSVFPAGQPVTPKSAAQKPAGSNLLATGIEPSATGENCLKTPSSPGEKTKPEHAGASTGETRNPVTYNDFENYLAAEHSQLDSTFRPKETDAKLPLPPGRLDPKGLPKNSPTKNFFPPAKVRLQLEVKSLIGLPAAVRKRIWRLAALESGVRPGDLRAIHLEQLDRMLVEHHKTGPFPLPGKIRAWRPAGTWYLVFTSETSQI